MHTTKTTPTALPTDIATYLARLGVPATPDGRADLQAGPPPNWFPDMTDEEMEQLAEDCG